MNLNGFILQLFYGMVVTLELAFTSLIIGMLLGVFFTILESSPRASVRRLMKFTIFIVRGLPELLVLFFIYFGLSIALNNMFNINFNVSPFIAGVSALSIIFGIYASQVFKGAFAAIDGGQTEAARGLGFSRLQILFRIQLPQAWRHAIPGLGNLWLALLKDTSIVMLVGINDLMSAAKLSASTTRQPFTFFLIAAGLYLCLTSFSQKGIQYFSYKANRHINYP